MENPCLMKPDVSMSEEIKSYRQEFLEMSSSMDGCGPLRRYENPADWLAFNRVLESKETCPNNWVPSTQYVYVRKSDNRIVGMIQLRHYFNEYLEKYAGHIGYSVRPSERRKGYAVNMLHDILSHCREVGLERVLVSCLEDNEASRRTILRNGGVYESTVYEPKRQVYLQRYWITLS